MARFARAENGPQARALSAPLPVDIVQLDVRKLSDFTDFMIIANGRSARQVGALAENVVMKAKEAGEVPLGVEGLRGGEWILVDLCDVVVHVMQPEVREFYQLEKMWLPSQEAAAAPS